MMPLRMLSVLCCLVFLHACRPGDENKTDFPINSFLQQELSVIDSLPIAVFRTRTSNGINDTAIVEKKVFRAFALKLLGIDLKNNKNNYEQLVLEDIQLGNISISYSTEDADAALKKIELNINAGSNKIKSIFAERHEQEGDMLLIRKILWTTGTEMMVNTCHYKDGELSKNITERFNWTLGN